MSDEPNDKRRQPGDNDGTPIAGHLTPVQLLGLTALAIFVGEALIMFVMPLVEPMGVTLRAVLDAVSLTLLASPFLYYLLFRPMVRHLDDRRAAELALRELNQSLEQRVADRTDELRRSNKALVREIQERKSTEDRIRRTNAFIQRLIESAPCLMATIDVNSLTCNYVNGRIEDFLGLSPETLVAGGGTFFDAVAAPATRERCRAMIRDIAVAPEGEIVRDQCELMGPDGSPLRFRVALVVASRTAIGEAEEVLLVATPEDDCG